MHGGREWFRRACGMVKRLPRWRAGISMLPRGCVAARRRRGARSRFEWLGSALQLLVTLAVIAATLLDPPQTTVPVGLLVGPVLIEAGVHARLSRRLLRIFRRDRRWKHGIAGRTWRRRAAGRGRRCGRSGGGRIGAALRFTEIAPILAIESARGLSRLVLGTALLHRECLERLPRTHKDRADERHETYARHSLTNYHGKPP